MESHSLSERLDQYAEVVESKQDNSGLATDLREAARYVALVDKIAELSRHKKRTTHWTVIFDGDNIDLTTRMSGGNTTILEAIESCRKPAMPATSTL